MHKLRTQLYWILLPPALGAIIPSAVIFCLQVFVANISPLVALADVIQRQAGKDTQLWVIAAINIIPFVTLSIICSFLARSIPQRRLNCIGLSGLVGILALMIPLHIDVWYPVFSGQRTSSTGPVGLVFAPFYCLGTLFVGLLVGWLACFRRS